MKIVRVGDPHIRPQNIAEAELLMQFIYNLCTGAPTDRLEILGDLFHTHAVVRLEVLEFWNKWLQRFSDVIETVVLVGNHDLSGD
jgi:UDP-2,3-diacylglucosamine pyrophosphatase LpxH